MPVLLLPGGCWRLGRCLLLPAYSPSSGCSSLTSVQLSPPPAVDYSLPPVPVMPQLVVSLAPVPEVHARALGGPTADALPRAVTILELEATLAAAASSEAELHELSTWFYSLSEGDKEEALTAVAKQLSYGAPVGEASAPAPAALRLPEAKPSLTVYCDATSGPGSAPATALAAAAAPSRPLALSDLTNLQAIGSGTAAGAGVPAAKKTLKKLASSLHMAHSQKVTPQVGGWVLQYVGAALG